MSIVKAPWTDDQVASLWHWQFDGDVHPFTCGTAGCGAILAPSDVGWECPNCDYVQDWAHDFMLGGAIDIDECHVKTWRGNCRCEPLCLVCGERKHMAVHGPIFGQPPGSKPYGHPYVPASTPKE